MNADQLNITWVEFGKQIGAVHRKFAQEKADLVRAALQEMKAETGFAPTVDFYTNSSVCDETGQKHFFWVPQINQDDIDAETVDNVEQFIDYLQDAQNVKFLPNAKSVVMLQEAIKEFDEAVAPGMECFIFVSAEHTRIEINVDIGGMAVKA